MRAPNVNRVSAIVAVADPVLSPSRGQVVIVTPTSDLVVRCDPDTDEIVISRQKKKRRDGVVLVAGSFYASWTWLMINQQGYTDGFRIQLGDRTNRLARVFEFVAIASTIEIYEGVKYEANQTPDPTRLARAESGRIASI